MRIRSQILESFDEQKIQYNNEESARTFVHVSQSADVGVSPVVVYAKEGIGFGFESGRVRVVS
jgi:hypothetical protein